WRLFSGAGGSAGAIDAAADRDPRRHPDRLRRRALLPMAAASRAPRVPFVIATLELQHVEATYPGRRAEQPVLQGIDLAVRAGEMCALIGPNGAGKSTLLRVAAGLLRPRLGRALLDGTDLAVLSAGERARRIAVVPQEGPIPAGLFVREMVSLGRTPYARLLLGPTPEDRRAVDWAIAAAGIGSLADR